MKWVGSVGVLAACAFLALATTAAAQVVVLFSRGPSAAMFPQGRVLPANQVLNLKAGDRLELLDGSGSHVLTGPVTTPAGHVPPKVGDQLIKTFLNAQQTRPGIAATRGFETNGADGAGAGVWQLDISNPGPQCLARDAAPSLWRADVSTPLTVQLTRVATGVTIAVTWPNHAESTPWPAILPTDNGEQYTVTFDDGTINAFVWRTVDVDPASGFAGLAVALSHNDCYGQLDRLKAAFAAG